jgi:hypothetical protein
MKKAILALGKQLNRKQQSEIKGGIGCKGLNWEVKYQDNCNCFMYYRYSSTTGVASFRMSDEEAASKCGI